jgi:ribosomal protein S18 acetylase RimI-like enzyme
MRGERRGRRTAPHRTPAQALTPFPLPQPPTPPPPRAVIGKAEGAGEEWHGHVSAVTVAPEFRRLGLARTLCSELERVSDKM